MLFRLRLLCFVGWPAPSKSQILETHPYDHSREQQLPFIPSIHHIATMTSMDETITRGGSGQISNPDFSEILRRETITCNKLWDDMLERNRQWLLEYRAKVAEQDKKRAANLAELEELQRERRLDEEVERRVYAQYAGTVVDATETEEPKEAISLPEEERREHSLQLDHSPEESNEEECHVSTSSESFDALLTRDGSFSQLYQRLLSRLPERIKQELAPSIKSHEERLDAISQAHLKSQAMWEKYCRKHVAEMAEIKRNASWWGNDKGDGSCGHAACAAMAADAESIQSDVDDDDDDDEEEEDEEDEGSLQDSDTWSTWSQSSSYMRILEQKRIKDCIVAEAKRAEEAKEARRQEQERRRSLNTTGRIQDWLAMENME